jgi:hypothetical protein
MQQSPELITDPIESKENYKIPQEELERIFAIAREKVVSRRGKAKVVKNQLGKLDQEYIEGRQSNDHMLGTEMGKPLILYSIEEAEHEGSTEYAGGERIETVKNLRNSVVKYLVENQEGILKHCRQRLIDQDQSEITYEDFAKMAFAHIYFPLMKSLDRSTSGGLMKFPAFRKRPTKETVLQICLSYEPLKDVKICINIKTESERCYGHLIACILGTGKASQREYRTQRKGLEEKLETIQQREVELPAIPGFGGMREQFKILVHRKKYKNRAEACGAEPTGISPRLNYASELTERYSQPRGRDRDRSTLTRAEIEAKIKEILRITKGLRKQADGQVSAPAILEQLYNILSSILYLNSLNSKGDSEGPDFAILLSQTLQKCFEQAELMHQKAEADFAQILWREMAGLAQLVDYCIEYLEKQTMP